MTGGAQAQAQTQAKNGALVVGHYCHDLLKLSSGREVESLGGSVSYITNILDAVGLHSTVVSKVGSDFAYAAATKAHPPSATLSSAKTTQFYADFTGGKERVLRVSNACEPIFPSDIPSCFSADYAIGLAVGVAREIVPETLRRMAQVSDLLVVDIQALIRTIDPSDGTVGLQKLCETEFHELVDGISYLKASTLEADYVDIEQVRQRTCVIVTEGKEGCRVYERDREFHVPAFPALEVDPTGAGDSFLAGFSAGLMWGLNVDHAALAGNFFGSLAVAHIGLPRFTHLHLQRLHEVLERWIKNGIYGSIKMDSSRSPTLMDSSDFTELRIVEEQPLQEELDESIKHNICIHTEVDSVEIPNSPRGEELGDFCSELHPVENMILQEDLNKR